MKRRPRLLAGLWFAGAALLAVGPTFGVLTLRQERYVAMAMCSWGFPSCRGGWPGPCSGSASCARGGGFCTRH